MAVDTTQIGRGREASFQGDQDVRVMQKVTIIAVLALGTLAALKFGFLQRILP